MAKPPPLPKYVVEQQLQNLLKKDNPNDSTKDERNSGKTPSYNGILNTVNAVYETKREKPPSSNDLRKMYKSIYGDLKPPPENSIEKAGRDAYFIAKKAERDAFYDNFLKQLDAIEQTRNDALTKVQDINKKKIEYAELMKRIKNATPEEFEEMLKERDEKRNQTRIMYTPLIKENLKKLHEQLGGRKKKTRSKKHKKKSRSSRKR